MSRVEGPVPFDEARAALRFRNVALPGDEGTLLSFARDLFSISFPEHGWFDQRFGSGSSYLAWVEGVTGGVGQYASLAVLGDVPVGLVVVGPELGHPGTGHVYHYYLAPAVRGRGLGSELDRHARAVLSRGGMQKMRLHVAP